MKGILQGISVVFFFITLPIALFQGYLLYSHVRATELMWFLFWFNVPVVIFAQIISLLLREASKK